MTRRTLDTIFVGGGLLVAALLVVLGFALAGEQAFATTYVKEELGAQKIIKGTGIATSHPSSKVGRRVRRSDIHRQRGS